MTSVHDKEKKQVCCGESLVRRSNLQCDFLLIVETFSQFVFGHR